MEKILEKILSKGYNIQIMKVKGYTTYYIFKDTPDVNSNSLNWLCMEGNVTICRNEKELSDFINKRKFKK